MIIGFFGTWQCLDYFYIQYFSPTIYVIRASEGGFAGYLFWVLVLGIITGIFVMFFVFGSLFVIGFFKGQKFRLWWRNEAKTEI